METPVLVRTVKLSNLEKRRNEASSICFWGKKKKKFYTAAQNSINVRKISLCQILQEIKRRATHTILVTLALPKNIYVDIK